MQQPSVIQIASADQQTPLAALARSAHKTSLYAIGPQGVMICANTPEEALAIYQRPLRNLPPRHLEHLPLFLDLEDAEDQVVSARERLRRMYAEHQPGQKYARLALYRAEAQRDTLRRAYHAAIVEAGDLIQTYGTTVRVVSVGPETLLVCISNPHSPAWLISRQGIEAICPPETPY